MIKVRLYMNVEERGKYNHEKIWLGFIGYKI